MQRKENLETITFSFGKNWQLFLNTLNADHIRTAQSSITEFLEGNDLKGKSFLDIGCGSGLFSYSAFNLGAKKIVSIDVDPFSIKCCEYMWEKAGRPDFWQIFHGSVLDEDFLRQFGKFDVVYSWGVLHHTGHMWDAIKNSALLVNEGGYYYIALYHKVDGLMGYDFWLTIKKVYNVLPKVGKWLMECGYMVAFFILEIIRRRNPFHTIKNYNQQRGMNWKRDISDWLGGYPYEAATVDEVTGFMTKNFPEFQLVNTKKTDHVMGLNWFLYKNKI